jgi:CDGSH-type Zn-finger protein
MVKSKKPAKKAVAQMITVTKNGPYRVAGSLPLSKQIMVPGKDGDPIRWKEGERSRTQDEYFLCRCGGSKGKPYCDSSHMKNRFNGKETASRKKYIQQAERIPGPKLLLTDAEALCSAARFCHLAGGTWKLTEDSDDKKSRKLAIQTACDCPSGRLVAWDKKTKKAIERKFKPSIGLIEDPGAGVSGPIWARGMIQLVSSDGSRYEKRNRMTLCRCGGSKNKPFCDGNHMDARFNDGDKSLKKK